MRASVTPRPPAVDPRQPAQSMESSVAALGCGRSARLPAEHPSCPFGWVEQQVDDEGGPPGLVTGAEAGAVVAVEVLEEQQVVAPRGVLGEQPLSTEDGASSGLVGEPDADQTVSQVAGHLTDRALLAGSGRILEG